MNDRKVKLYISMSLDGFIATQDDDISWLSAVEVPGEDYGYNAFTKDIDTYIIGRKTYDVVKEILQGQFPQAQQYTCYIITRQETEDRDGVHFYSGNIEDLISKIKSQKGGHIYCDGGGQIVHLLMEKNLIDEYIISIIPTLLGDGKRLFVGGVPPIQIEAKSCKYYESGLIQLHYVKKQD